MYWFCKLALVPFMCRIPVFPVIVPQLVTSNLTFRLLVESDILAPVWIQIDDICGLVFKIGSVVTFGIITSAPEPGTEFPDQLEPVFHKFEEEPSQIEGSALIE